MKRKSRAILFESRVKNPQNLGKIAMSKQRKKKQGTVKDIEENEKQAEIERIRNAIDDIKSLLSKHIAQTSENRPNPSNKEKSKNFERGSGHGNVSNITMSKIRAL